MSFVLAAAVMALALALTVHLLTGPSFRGVGREVRAGAAVVLGLVLAVAWSDLAQAAPNATEGTVAEIRLSALTVTLVISVFIPILTGVLTKLDTSATVKAVVNLVLNAVNAAIVAAVVADGSAIFSEEVIITTLIGMAVSVASYLGFYRPVELNAKLAPDKGI
jgi:hypothetical protein